ncbi:hypothetical protein [Ketobacter sp.]|uniref:hypothetical protein n=1 Tax=Ketobacter sp. TaxID=2083498 RepID=UPI0025BEAD8E|nr:hypothetical protein [Ketobacter sp.]
MNYIDVMKFCLALPKAERKLLTPSGTAFALTVDSNTFGYFQTGAPIQWQFTLRVTPQHYVELPDPPRVRQVKEQPDEHWLTIERVENFDGELLKQLITWSYQQAQTL